MTQPAPTYPWFAGEKRVFKRRSKLTPSQWCDKHLVIGKGGQRWRADMTPAVAKLMDLIAKPWVRKITGAKGVQIGGTVGLGFGYLAWDIDRNGGDNVLVAMADEKAAQKIIRGKLHPVLTKTAPLRDLLTANAKDIQLQEITLANGTTIYAGWATSINTLSSQDCRIVIKDEFAKWPSAIAHGTSASAEADARATTYPDTCKILEFSTPTVKGGPLDESLEEADVVYHYQVACPHCGEMQEMHWDRFWWPEEASPKEIRRDRLGRYCCCGCQEHWADADRDLAVAEGEWVPDRPVTRPQHIGAIIPGWLSRWNSLSVIVAKWLQAQGKPSKLMSWHNLYAAASYEKQEGERLPWQDLYDRREKYPRGRRDPARLAVPMGAGVLTAAADVQDDRIEVQVTAWGKEEESWEMENAVLLGSTLQPQVWSDLWDYLRQTWEHQGGAELRIACACIDTGFRARTIYQFIRNKFHRRIYGIKGASQFGKPLVSRPSRSNLGKVPIFLIGTDEAKELILGRLKTEAPGPGYIHYPDTFDEEYFQQLTAEECIQVWKGGRMVRMWNKKRDRNEAIDLRVYNEAALAILRPKLNKLVDALAAAAEEQAETVQLDLAATAHPPEEKPAPVPKSEKKRTRKARPGGWVNKWRP